MRERSQVQALLREDRADLTLVQLLGSGMDGEVLRAGIQSSWRSVGNGPRKTVELVAETRFAGFRMRPEDPWTSTLGPHAGGLFWMLSA